MHFASFQLSFSNFFFPEVTFCICITILQNSGEHLVDDPEENTTMMHMSQRKFLTQGFLSAESCYLRITAGATVTKLPKHEKTK